MITYCFLEYPIILYTYLFHVDTLSTKKNSASSALICCALHQREEAVLEPSGCKRLLRLTRPHPIMRILAGYSPMPPRKIKAWFFQGSCDLIFWVPESAIEKNVAKLSSLTNFVHCAFRAASVSTRCRIVGRPCGQFHGCLKVPWGDPMDPKTTFAEMFYCGILKTFFFWNGGIYETSKSIYKWSWTLHHFLNWWLNQPIWGTKSCLIGIFMIIPT